MEELACIKTTEQTAEDPTKISENYDDHYDANLFQGGTFAEMWDSWITAAAKQSAHDDYELFSDLWDIKMNLLDAPRSLAALVHEKDPTKTILYVNDKDSWFWKPVPVVVDIDSGNIDKMINNLTDPQMKSKKKGR